MIFLEQTFKTIQIACYIVGKETDENRVYRFLLPKILASHTKEYTSKQLMNEYLESLYGAYFKTGVERIGDYHLMHITLTIVHPDLVNDSSLFYDALNLFKDVLDPNREIEPSIFEEEKRLYIEQHKSMSDRKRTYANYQFNKHFFKGDLYQKPLYGGLKSLREANHINLISHFKEMISNNHVITISHGILSDEQKAYVERIMPKSTRSFDTPKLTPMKEKKKVCYVKEQTKMKQAIIKMGFLLPVFRYDKDYEAAILFDTILGGFPDSKLFQIIREEKGLCYDVYSNYDGMKGILTITSGVDKSNHEVAVSSIEKVINDMEKEMTSLDLKHAKQYVIHQLKSNLDSQSAGTRRAFSKVFLNLTDSIDQRIKKIEAVTLDDLVDISKKMTLDTVYVLEGVSDEKDSL